MKFALLALVALWMSLCGGAVAASPPDPAALAAGVDAVVSQWMSDNSIADATVAVARNGVPIASFAHGWQPTDRHPVASLSKAITGVCIGDLVADGKLAFGDTLGTVLASFFKQNGEPKDPRFKTITIEQLLTHRSGLPRNAVDDAVDHTIIQSVKTAAQTMLDNDPGTHIAYSDTGYLLLGFIAEHVARQTYSALCARVFAQAGLPPDAGIIDPTLTARAPNGGWSISAESYVKFLNLFNPGAALLSPQVQQWIDGLPGDPGYAHEPCPRYAGSPAYGLGVCIERTKAGVRLYHDGLLHHDKYYPETGGSFFFINEQGFAAVVIFSGENDGKAYKALETGVMRAMSPGR